MLGRHFNKPIIISVCEALKTEMIRLGMPGERIHALRNGVDLELFHPEPYDQARTELGMDGPKRSYGAWRHRPRCRRAPDALRLAPLARHARRPGAYG